MNKTTRVTESAGRSWATPCYNPAGNMSSIPKPVNPTVSYDATFDAWNRLVKLEDGTNTVAEYEYDGMKYQTIAKSYSSGSLSETRHYYYSDQWQVLEERVGSSADAERQFIWGQDYIDDCVLRDRDTTANGTLDEQLYSLQDANWNVIALTDENGDVQERNNYSAYGTPAFYNASFTSQSSSSYGWKILFAGYRLDEISGLFYVRNRYLHSQLGIWISRDPIGFEGEDMNLYPYVKNSPVMFVDPSGEQYASCIIAVTCLARQEVACSAACAYDPIWDNVCDTWSDCFFKCRKAKLRGAMKGVSDVACYAAAYACGGRILNEWAKNAGVNRLPKPVIPQGPQGPAGGL